MERLRGVLAGLLLGLMWLVLSQQGVLAQDGNGIVVPAAGAEISGVVTVEGAAAHPTFRKWQLDLVTPGAKPQVHFLALGEKPVSKPAELYALDTRHFPNGTYTLRLRVVYQGMNYDEYFVPIEILNTGATVDGSNGGDNSGEDDAPAEAGPVVFRTDAPAEGKRWIEVDISDQSLTAWQGDVPVFQTTVSTGKPGWRTLPGKFKVYVKYEKTRMTGDDYDTPDVPWTMYYSGDFAIHGAYWHDNFGTPVSHGCVNLRVPEAQALFDWASVGTEVVVNQ